jgi:type II secretory pathway pseudopilin PulG
MRAGHTLPELMVAAMIVAATAAIVLPPLGRALDRAVVQEGAYRFSSLHAATRQVAIARGTLARLDLDPAGRTAVLTVRGPGGGWDTVTTAPLGVADIDCSNPTMVFSPTGVGYGTSNTRVVFRRGAAADTVTTSRTGRLRW